MALFTKTLGLYGGVLWCGELQGFIVHEMIPIVPAGAFLPVACGVYGDGEPGEALVKRPGVTARGSGPGPPGPRVGFVSWAGQWPVGPGAMPHVPCS
jgi:hypothetical protein